VRESPKERPLSADEITARLNEIYRDNPAVIDEDIQLAQYNLSGEGGLVNDKGRNLVG
jgi:hypothetical protein